MVIVDETINENDEKDNIVDEYDDDSGKFEHKGDDETVVKMMTFWSLVE